MKTGAGKHAVGHGGKDKIGLARRRIGLSEPPVTCAIIWWRPGLGSFGFLGTKTGVGGPGFRRHPGAFPAHSLLQFLANACKATSRVAP
jgi:hypothetical protein